MDYQEFYQRTNSKLPPGEILPNLRQATTTTIIRYTDTNMIYKRGESQIYVSMPKLFNAYRTFSGKTVTSTDLRRYAPQVFDSNRSGHNCNCTLLFMVLKEIGVVTTIEGEGTRGNPFRVTIPLPANEYS